MYISIKPVSLHNFLLLSFLVEQDWLRILCRILLSLLTIAWLIWLNVPVKWHKNENVLRNLQCIESKLVCFLTTARIKYDLWLYLDVTLLFALYKLVKHFILTHAVGLFRYVILLNHSFHDLAHWTYFQVSKAWVMDVVCYTFSLKPVTMTQSSRDGHY